MFKEDAVAITESNNTTKNSPDPSTFFFKKYLNFGLFVIKYLYILAYRGGFYVRQIFTQP